MQINDMLETSGNCNLLIGYYWLYSDHNQSQQHGAK